MFKDHYEGTNFGQEPISFGRLFAGDENRFRGIYLKIIFPKIEMKRTMSNITFLETDQLCKRNLLLRLSLVNFKWKNLTFTKHDYWFPVDNYHIVIE